MFQGHIIKGKNPLSEEEKAGYSLIIENFIIYIYISIYTYVYV